MSTKFNPQIDYSGSSASVIEAPNIEYDQKEIKPGIIEQQKWDILYKVTIFVSLLFVVFINFFISKIYDIRAEMAEVSVRVEDSAPVIDKIINITKGVKYDDLKLNRYLLENLFYVGDKDYEIINKLKNFFENDEVIRNYGTFNLKNIQISGDIKEGKNIGTKQIRLEGSFNNINTDLIAMLNFLNNMTPVVIVEGIKFLEGNNVIFTGKILVMKSDFLKYDYGTKYKQINELVRLKEEYHKNKIILEQILKDKDINFKKVGISKIYNCTQYEKLLDKQNILKPDDVEQCKDVEALVLSLKKDLNNKFSTLQ